METTTEQQLTQPTVPVDEPAQAVEQLQGQEALSTPTVLKKGKLGHDDALIRETNTKATGYSSYTMSEKKTFVRYVNDVMRSEHSWQPLDPVDPTNQLIERMKDGKVLWFAIQIFL